MSDVHPTWKCSCGGETFCYEEEAMIEATGVIENGEFTIDDVVGHRVLKRSNEAVCMECGREYPFAGTQGGEQ